MTLPPELARVADAVIASGVYEDLDAVLKAAAEMLREREAERRAFIVLLEEAEAEGERDGFVTIEQMEAEMDEIIGASEHRRD